MATKKIQQPLLFIQQPTFEKIIAPMQQYFISKKPNNLQSVDQEYDQENDLIIEEKEGILIDTPIVTNIPRSQEEMIDKTVVPFGDETVDPNVLEFILTVILT